MKECTEEINIPIIVLEEKGKTMIFLNKDRKIVKKILVDGGAIIKGIRCDWLVINDKSYEHFVELKGTDVKHACEQLSVSISKLSADSSKKAKHSFVIAAKVVPAITTTIQNLKAQFKKKFNCTLIVKSRQGSFEL